jgi:hypothetical protein
MPSGTAKRKAKRRKPARKRKPKEQAPPVARIIRPLPRSLDPDDERAWLD